MSWPSDYVIFNRQYVTFGHNTCLCLQSERRGPHGIFCKSCTSPASNPLEHTNVFTNPSCTNAQMIGSGLFDSQCNEVPNLAFQSRAICVSSCFLSVRPPAKLESLDLPTQLGDVKNPPQRLSLVTSFQAVTCQSVEKAREALEEGQKHFKAAPPREAEREAERSEAERVVPMVFVLCRYVLFTMGVF